MLVFPLQYRKLLQLAVQLLFQVSNVPDIVVAGVLLVFPCHIIQSYKAKLVIRPRRSDAVDWLVLAICSMM